MNGVIRKQTEFELDYELAVLLKMMYKFRCQFPCCNAKIPRLKLKRKENYVEVNNITQLKHKDDDRIDNIIVVCPNHIR